MAEDEPTPGRGRSGSRCQAKDKDKLEGTSLQRTAGGLAFLLLTSTINMMPTRTAIPP
jgi:hypothetical protein